MEASKCASFMRLPPHLAHKPQVEASMCHLRGLLMLKLNRGDQAKQCFMEALALDVKCYDAFEQLISSEMMTPEEGWLHFYFLIHTNQYSLPEWHFIQSLSYPSQLTPPHSPMSPSRPTITAPDAEFIRLIYTARLRKYHHPVEHQLARTKLVEEFGLGDNPDVLFSFADALYAGFRWADCFAVTDRCVALHSILLKFTHHSQLEYCH